MSQVNSYDRESYTTNGVAKSFSFGWNVNSTDDVKVAFVNADGVILNSATFIDSNDDEYTTSNYAFTVELNRQGGQVVFVDTPAEDQYLIIYRKTPQVYENSFKTATAFPAVAIDKAYSKIWMAIQEISSDTLHNTIRLTPNQRDITLDAFSEDNNGAILCFDSYNKKISYTSFTTYDIQNALVLVARIPQIEQTADDALTLAWNAKQAATTAQNTIDGHIVNTSNPHQTSIFNLTDTQIISPDNGDILRFDGTKWVNSSSDVTVDWGEISGDISDQTDLMEKIIVKTEIMPIASADLAGAVYQYIGETTAPYEHGYIYECKELGGGIYGWERIDVQPGGSRGRFLALWNCATGLAESNPPFSPYEYKTGDYFVVGAVSTATPAVNYKPDGTSYVTGTASTTVETGEVAVDDTYFFDGTSWKLQSNSNKTVTFSNIAGDPYDNTALSNALNTKQGILVAGDNITINGTTISSNQVEFATYGTTTYAQIVAWNTAGKIVLCKDNNIYHRLAYVDAGWLRFTAISLANYYNVICSSANVWSRTSGTIQTINNAIKTGEVKTSTNNNYYSALKMDELLGAKANVSSLATVATTGDYGDLLNKPTLGTMAAESASDYTPTASLAAVALSGAYSDLSGTPSLAAVATSGQYSDLTGTPTIPTVNDATLTIQKNGTNVATFTANASSAVTANITVPTTTNDLTNNSGFITSSDIPVTDVTVGGTSVVSSGVAAVPAIPTVNDATITITQGGVTKGSFTLNQASGDTIALDAGGGGSSLDAGMLAPFATTTAPSGWLVCDGSAVSRTSYADLFTAIGTTYGTGDGSTTFNLPDLSGKQPIYDGTATIGDTTNGKAPNITYSESGNIAYLWNATGALRTTAGQGKRTTSNGSDWAYYSATFDASRCSAVYDNNATGITPAGVYTLWCIKY